MSETHYRPQREGHGSHLPPPLGWSIFLDQTSRSFPASQHESFLWVWGGGQVNCLPLQDKGCINCLAALVRTRQTKQMDTSKVTATHRTKGEGVRRRWQHWEDFFSFLF